MTIHEEAEAAIRVMETWFSVSDQTRTVVAWWREHMQPAVPNIPDGCELVEVDGVPVFRAPADDDYGWLDLFGRVMLLPVLRLRYGPTRSTDTFAGKRYIVRQVTPPAPTDVDRLARLLAVEQGMPWERQSTATKAYYVGKARRLYDRGVRYPEQTP